MTSPPLTAPRDLTVSAEPIQDIDGARYPEWPNHLAIEVEAFRTLLLKNIATNKLAADALTNEIGGRRLAETQRDQARSLARRNEWWKSYGVWLGIGGVLVIEAIIAGAVLLLTR